MKKYRAIISVIGILITGLWVMTVNCFSSTNFPTSLDSYGTKSAGNTISESHINDPQDAIEAIEAKVGIDSSAVTTSHDYILSNQRAFVDRGDPASVDFNVASLVTDATWRDLDLSAIVPAGAKAVVLRADINDEVVGSKLIFRKNGNTNTAAASSVECQAISVTAPSNIVVACDTNRVIEYWGTSVSFISINIVVLGWWF